MVAKDKSSKKTTDRWCIEKLMIIKHNWLLKNKKKSIRVSAYFKRKKKKRHYKNNQGVSLSFFNKKECEVSDSVSWEVAVSALREPQIISLWD